MPRYLGIPREKIRVVPLGINTHGFELREPNPDGPFTVGFLGRVAPEKGLHVLAEAYRLLRKELPAARLEVAGYMAPDCKSYLADVEQYLAGLGFAGEFRYHGVIDRADKIAFLRKLDVMSLPATYDEPKGVSLLEAMACGVPLVQPRRGSFTEIVESTGGGLLVRPDDPDALAGGLLKIANDKKLAAELGANGFRGVREHYSAAHMADRLLDAYAAFGNPVSSTASAEEVRVARG
jgi:glycosyltransferase involved in cell wall biosynthesis